MPNEVIDLRKRASLMNAVSKTPPMPLVVSNDARPPEMYIPAPSVAPDKIQSPPDAHVLTASVAPVDTTVHSDEKLLTSTHDSIIRSDREPSNNTHASLSKTNPGFDLEWSSYEHEYRIRGPYWFLYPLSGATAGIVFGITTQNYLFVSFVVISFLMLAYYAKRPPRMLTYAIEKRGVWLENKLVDYRKLKSFWIFTHAFMAPELLLETENLINPLIHVRLEEIDPDDVRVAISQYLPEKEQKDLASHQIARIIGF